MNLADTDEDYNGLLYEGVPYTGEVVEHGSEGHLISSYNYDGGVADGPYAEWFGPGRPYKQGTINFGLLIGVNRKWHPNGQLAMETEYDDKGRQLYRREWDPNGVLTYEHVA
ncbi:toxin-antitoxin system YwqK family antitoxin [Lentzea sp. HUAS TT2]|uniref:toxin-antitoxin system YwqK family antitoxin n=1 Tax=Lentzea sp. HUAS TT2 TaxID=3447454 RepID=UPI003F6FABD0